MPTYKVEVGPHYTPAFDVYTVEADDEAEAQELAEAEAISYWKELRLGVRDRRSATGV